MSTEVSAQEEARMFEESAIMTPPAELPGYFKGRERGSFPDVAHEITLDLWYYHHQVRAQEFLPYSDALFTEPPDMSGPNPLTYYVAVFNSDGTYKFQPHDKKALVYCFRVPSFSQVDADARSGDIQRASPTSN